MFLQSSGAQSTDSVKHISHQELDPINIRKSSNTSTTKFQDTHHDQGLRSHPAIPPLPQRQLRRNRLLPYQCWRMSRRRNSPHCKQLVVNISLTKICSMQ